jgi:hypothetical protein
MKSATIHDTFSRKGQLTKLALDNGLSNLNMCMSHLRALPYGRNANRVDSSLVFIEGKGTCSSKHAALKSIAMEQEMDQVKLVLCIYKMNSSNTPGIGSHIDDAQLEYIPEAHCYLDVDGEKIDLTTVASSLEKIKNDILYEEFISPNQVSEYKVNTHKKYVQDWLASENIEKTFEEVWSIREHCIAALSTINI